MLNQLGLHDTVPYLASTETIKPIFDVELVVDSSLAPLDLGERRPAMDFQLSQ